MGAQTFIMEPGLLDYWRGFDPAKGLEESKLTKTVSENLIATKRGFC